MADISLQSAREMLAPEAPPASQVGVVALAAREPVLGLAERDPDHRLGCRRSSGSSTTSCRGSRHSVWNASSLTECRQIIADTLGRGRRRRLLRGHPRALEAVPLRLLPDATSYWRPTLAFVAAARRAGAGPLRRAAAQAPLVLAALPRHLPTGCSGAARSGCRSRSTPASSSAGSPTASSSRRLGRCSAPSPRSSRRVDLVALCSSGRSAAASRRLIPIGAAARSVSKHFGGFMLSLIIGMTGIAFSLPLGILLALGRRSDMFIVKTISVGFIEFIRGVPLITLLLVATFLLNVFLPPGTNFDIILRVIIMVTLFAVGLHRRDRSAAASPRCRAASTRRPTRSGSTTGSRCGWSSCRRR